MDLVKILYISWFVLPMALYISCGPFIFLSNLLPSPKKFLKRLSTLIAIVLLLFYVIVPVPKSVQGQFIRDVNNFVYHNNEATLNHVKMAQIKYCQFPYMSAIAYFQFKRAYLEDFEVTFQRQKSVSSGPLFVPKIALASEICKTDFI